MEDYYDIDAILAEDQNVKCAFQSNIPGLAWLEGGHDDALKAGSRFDIPFWLARELVEHDEETVGIDIETPEYFGPKVRNALRADANTVDLTKQCPNFFRFGTVYLQLVDDVALSGVMEEAFKARLQMTMDHTQSGGNSNTTDYLNRLDETERALYKAGMESSASIHQWNQHSFGRIRSASEMLLKRKAT
ncbi:DNA replication protein [Mortierella hygrophila]|uniref:DNA replication complex GINS protein PSF3 n=1 Tax=Mortierella hygrophila TaxID=979708 RepID=A0A9P6K065_9FUNG|nr:DNA replication protein [Mortierella hygrophila]